MSDNTELHTASIRLAEATRYFSMAYGVGVTDHMASLRDAWRTQAIEHLQSAADAIGFELVEKQPLIVMSKHDFMDRILRVSADDRDGMKTDVNGNLYQRD